MIIREDELYQVKVKGTFAAAHYLSEYNGKCENIHGHNYIIWVYARGQKLDKGNMLIDFGVLKKALKKVFEQLDHKMLNEIPFFESNPSAERIAEFVYIELKKILPNCPLYMVEAAETEDNIAAFLPEE
jgi:6-pyruvoyltetrahydropterin/6-carboxytetrahydropterin synthase